MSSIKGNVVLRVTGALFTVASLMGAPALAQGSAVLTGTVLDASTKQPVADVVVTATSPSMQGEQFVVTDSTGLYRIPQLPPGTYTIRLEKESFKLYSRAEIRLPADRTIRVNVEMLPEAIQGETITVVGKPPTVDVGSTTTGVNVSSDFMNKIAVVSPGARGGATRSFESLAVVAPGAQTDTFGVSISGTTSPENQYVVDGLSVNDPGFGLNATPLTVEFVQEVNVITGGYMPEYGRATGGIMSAVTKSGSNEFHGSVFANWAPGALTGEPTKVIRQGQTITTDDRLWNLGDVGFELGGPIMKEKLWFFAGFAPSLTRNRLERNLNAFQFDAAGNKVLDADGFHATQPIPGTQEFYFADQRTFQYIGKLTYLINQNHNIALSVIGSPTTSGGPNTFSIDNQAGGSEVGLISGPFEALAHYRTTNTTDVSLKLTSSFLDKRVLLDGTLGWHHQDGSILPSDRSALGANDGLAGISRVMWGRTPNASGTRTYHSITDFEALSPEAAAACAPRLNAAGKTILPCPVTSYNTGGPAFLGEDILDRYQGRLVGTYMLKLLGHHVIKAGVDLESVSYHRRKGYSGSVLYREHSGGAMIQDYREYGFMTGPDTVEVVPVWDALSKSTTMGGFVQDSWNVLDMVTINAGVRYDTQMMWGNDNKLAMVLPNQISPRIGMVYDFTQQGRSKLYANYARFYENATLDMIDRQFPGERQITTYRYRAPGVVDPAAPGCNALDPAQQEGACRDPLNLYTFDTLSPNAHYIITGGDKSPIDPNLKNQSSDEFVLGGEYEVLTDARVGGSYTKRYMNDVIEDMSRDEATTYFIGNPGSGIATDFPKATRDYDAFTIFVNRNFADLWLAQVSYTWASLHGNYNGLFRPETGQLDPNINSDFDLVSLLDNRTGPLAGDRTHQIKMYGNKDFVLSGGMTLSLGLSYTTRSGAPLNYFGRHYLYGAQEVFILPRGAGGRLPWVHNIDGRLGFNYKISKDSQLTLSVDMFNVFNFQQEVGRDQTYTNDEVEALKPADCGGQPCTKADLDTLSVAKNPNFGNTTAYQAPRTIRFGAKVSF